MLNYSYKGYSGKLSEDEIIQLDEHLKENTYLRIQDIVAQVAKQYKVRYSISGMTELLHRLGYVYKKPKLVPGKADAKAQEEFIESYQEIKESKGTNDPIHFINRKFSDYWFKNLKPLWNGYIRMSFYCHIRLYK